MQRCVVPLDLESVGNLTGQGQVVAHRQSGSGVGCMQGDRHRTLEQIALISLPCGLRCAEVLLGHCLVQTIDWAQQEVSRIANGQGMPIATEDAGGKMLASHLHKRGMGAASLPAGQPEGRERRP